MSRIADAQRRARADSAQEPGIPFFAPGQPAMVSPWDIEGNRTGPPPGQVREVRPPIRSSTLLDIAADSDLRVPAEHADTLVVSPAIAPLVRLQYSRLAAALHEAQCARPIRVLLITSASLGDGKTLTTVNLALTFTEAYHRRVLIVDADLRQSMIHQVLGLSNARGLRTLSDEGPAPLVQVRPLLTALAAGTRPGDPMKTLTSDRLRALLEEARKHFDWILMDSPPVGLVPDAKVLQPVVDGTLLVARAGRTACDDLERAAAAFDAGRVLGVVLNDAPGHPRAWSRAADYDEPLPRDPR